MNAHQSETRKSYAGSDLLFRGEEALSRYNKWIVSKFVRSIRRHLSKYSIILDFGSGIATLSQIFEELTGIKPEGIERDPHQRKLAIARGFTTFESVSDCSGPYDCIFTSNVLEHIENDIEALAQLRTRLRDSGLLLVYVPAFNTIWTSLDNRVGHFRRYTRKGFARKLEQSGFRVLESSYCDSVGFLLALLFRVIGNANGEPSAGSLALYDRFLLPLSKALDHIAGRWFGKNLYVVAAPSNLAA